jgi:hypothetical protein
MHKLIKLEVAYFVSALANILFASNLPAYGAAFSMLSGLIILVPFFVNVCRRGEDEL